MQNLLKLVIVMSVFVTGCGEQNNLAGKFNWTEELVKEAVKESCITSVNWKDKSRQDIAEEDKSLQIVNYADTTSITNFPSAVVNGFCTLGQGSGWGSEIHFIGILDSANPKPQIINNILNEAVGLIVENEDLELKNKKVEISLSGYSDKAIAKCCRDVSDIASIVIENKKARIVFDSSNSFQARNIENLNIPSLKISN